MKKYIQFVVSLVLLLSLTACAPKTNHQSTNTNHEESESAPHAIYETFTLYFPDTENARLVKESHELRIYEDVTSEKIILDTLKMGPKDDQLVSPISGDALIRSLKTVSGLCTIDFTEGFLNLTDDNTEIANLMLYSIVQSLCELDTIQEVKFNIDGNTTAKINNQIDLSQPISPDPAKI